jgi:hypothetical protein
MRRVGVRGPSEVGFGGTSPFRGLFVEGQQPSRLIFRFPGLDPPFGIWPALAASCDNLRHPLSALYDIVPQN